MNYDRGDVVYGEDPFDNGTDARPWLLVSDDSHPFYGGQYIALTLTSKSWYDEGFELRDEHWLRGGMPENSKVVTWGHASPAHDDLDHDRWQGTLKAEAVDACVERAVDYMGL
ncbi:type II toxin-antitoxin system PemK/MazF family toxin [Halorussus amylolyticus]|uniref:type II toxin-antitoxin system PemK/MazF family toxin n=1 Tax=Halorussus amylolyticus TaxID=1126242 RepID=UPI001045691D|nr:type II toxin-antitoxin system PemK/MazF family toxin [Halorussus amylolyticus]